MCFQVNKNWSSVYYYSIEFTELKDNYCQNNTSYNDYQMSAFPGFPPIFLILKAKDIGASDFLKIIKASQNLKGHLVLAYILRQGKLKLQRKLPIAMFEY